MKKFFTILLLLLVGGAYAQTALAQIPFVQSRFFGMPQGIADTCQTCAPSTDGVLEYRLADETLEGTTTATYTVQMRVSGGDPDAKARTRLAFASVRLTYNNPVALLLSGFSERVVERGVCTYEPVGSFVGKYEYTFNDTTDNSFTITAFTPDQTTTASSLVKLNDEFQDFVEITCSIEDSIQDAGIAISGTDITSNMIYVYGGDNDANRTITARRNIFPLVHNDLLVFNLNGSAYIKDYASYSDGKGIRITFSHPLNMALTAANFQLVNISTTTLITRVIHNANEDVAFVEFDRIPEAGQRLPNAGPLLGFQALGLTGSDGTSLTTSSLMPALPSYDENAPRATGISRSSRNDEESTWVITTSNPLDPTTVKPR